MIGIVVVAGIFVAGMMYKNLRDTTNNMYTPVAKKTKSNKGRDLDTLLQEKKPINILLLGIDTGAMGRHWKGRTDTMMMICQSTLKRTPPTSCRFHVTPPQSSLTLNNMA